MRKNDKTTDNKEYSVKDAVALRFKNICASRGIAYNELANLAGITPSTVYSMLDPTRRDVSILTIKKLLDGLNMTLSDFFTSEEFGSLDQKI